MSKTVEVDFPGGKRVDAKIGDTVIRTDQSVKNGGGGTAPEPFQLFLASIATCAGIYALGFCQARKFSTVGMALTMTCDFDPEVERYVRLTLELRLPDDFPAEHEAAIIRSMSLCAVKKHLMNAPDFEITTVPHGRR